MDQSHAMQLPRDRAEIQNRFNTIDMHDSRLLSVSVLHPSHGHTQDIRIDLELLTHGYPEYEWTPAELTFKHCTYVRMSVDLEMKLLCGHAIATSWCELRSELQAELERSLMASEVGPLSEFLHFSIALCPPAGVIDVLAREFVLNIPTS